jgi:hypothetical protein
MNKLILSSLVLFTSFVNAANCEFIPTITQVGASGGSENKLFVCGDGSDYNCYSLGEGSDSQAKNRYATAMTALISARKVRLFYWGITSCEQARSQTTVLPTSTAIL